MTPKYYRLTLSAFLAVATLVILAALVVATHADEWNMVNYCPQDWKCVPSTAEEQALRRCQRACSSHSHEQLPGCVCPTGPTATPYIMATPECK